MSMSSLEEQAFRAEREMSRTDAFFPILTQLGNRWAASRPWQGRVIGINLHLTTVTGLLIRELVLGGATCIVSAANMATTDAGTVESMRNRGVEVYTGGDMRDRHMQVLSHNPEVLIDVGFDLIGTLLEKRPDLARNLAGAVEITRSGVTRLRDRADSLPFPVININDGRLKDAVENKNGVGAAIWPAVTALTGMHLSGRRLAVVGYGPVGRGLSSHAKATGMNVEVVEQDPVRRLFAHYDGFPTPELNDALSRAEMVVTATGRKHAIGRDLVDSIRDGMVMLNAGHGGDEIDVEGIRSDAVGVDQVSDQVSRYRMENDRQFTILGNGHPLNIVLNSGSPEPVLLHYAVLGLALEWLTVEPRQAGEIIVPDEVEAEAAILALSALDLTVSRPRA